MSAGGRRAALQVHGGEQGTQGFYHFKFDLSAGDSFDYAGRDGASVYGVCAAVCKNLSGHGARNAAVDELSAWSERLCIVGVVADSLCRGRDMDRIETVFRRGGVPLQLQQISAFPAAVRQNHRRSGNVQIHSHAFHSDRKSCGDHPYGEDLRQDHTQPRDRQSFCGYCAQAERYHV